MRTNQSQIKGAFRYLSFGCRQAWVEESLAGMGAIPANLGPRQAMALQCYLTDAGLLEPRANALTETGQLLSVLGPGSSIIWQVIWTNWVLRSPLFSWWATVPNGLYSREQCLESLSRHLHGSAERSIKDALCALVGTLRNTPVGALLGQGTVTGVGRGWTVLKTGPRAVTPWWAVYSAYLLVRGDVVLLTSDEDCRNTVANSVGVDGRSLAAAFESLWRPDLFRISREAAGSVHITLVSGLTPERVLRAWIAET